MPLLLESTLGFVSFGNSVRIKTTSSIRSSYYTTSVDTRRCNRHNIHSNLSNSSRKDDNGELQSKRDEVVGMEDYEFVPIQDGDITDDFIKDKLEGAPSELEIMKELLGISGFTYVLAFLIAFFLGMNLLLGPGWLGQQLGLEGRGTFTEISNSLPDSVDLSRSEFLL